MSDNPFKSDARAPHPGTMKVGEVRIIRAVNKDGHVVKELTIIRTDQSYAQDLCDAYNVSMSATAEQRGLVYRVINGTVTLTDDPDWSDEHTASLKRRAEAERNRWKDRNQSNQSNQSRTEDW